MKSIVFATNNENKLIAVRAMLKGDIKVISLKEAQFLQDIPEPYETIEENSVYKSYVVNSHLGCNVMADDTGLEVEALNGAPGVYSARYAGTPSNADNNMTKLLEALKEKDSRRAQFKTVASLIWEGKYYMFEGLLKGKILRDRRGGNGFGYDPVFLADGYDKTLAEMSPKEKYAISHRNIAFKKLSAFLERSY